MKWFSLGSYKPLFSLQKGQLVSGTFFYLIQYSYTRVSPRDSPYLLILHQRSPTYYTHSTYL